MRYVLTGLVFFCSSLQAEELKTIRIVVASDNDVTTEITDEHAKAMASALTKAAPEGMLEGFHYENGILTVFGYLPHRKSRQEIFRATHVSDCPVNSVFHIETTVSMIVLKRPIIKVAEIWSRARHPELKNSLLQEVKIDSKRVEVLFQNESVSNNNIVEPEVVVPEK